MAPKPNKYCEVYGCKQKRKGYEKDISFFTLPQNEERRRQWCELIGRPDLALPNIKYRSHAVCSVHFDQTDIVNVPRLNENALPSLLIPVPSTPEYIQESNQKDCSSQTTLTITDIHSISNKKADTQLDSTLGDNIVNTEQPQPTLALSSNSPRKSQSCQELNEQNQETRSQNELKKIRTVQNRYYKEVLSSEIAKF